MAAPIFIVGGALLFLFFLYMKFSDLFPGQQTDENNEAQEGFKSTDGEVAEESQDAEEATSEEEEQQSEINTEEQESSEEDSSEEKSDELKSCQNCGNKMFEKDGYTFLTCEECKKKICFNCGMWFENSQIALCNKCMGKEQPKIEAEANYEDVPIDETEFEKVL
jgi:hypothetical protein